MLNVASNIATTLINARLYDFDLGGFDETDA